jgi:saccharopine dehydrogenase (NAD+, L-lysine-forming)
MISLPGPLVVYGAYGKTGSMIAKVAVKRGHQVVLSGSDHDRLDRLSAEMGMPGVAARLDDQTAVRRVIRAAACVINVAGPFATTFRPMLQACSAEGVPYVDLNGELDVFRAMEDFMARQKPTIPVLTGAGFGVVAGECAAMHAAGALERPQRVCLGVVPDLLNIA